jgi:hypothetical protein
MYELEGLISLNRVVLKYYRKIISLGYLCSLHIFLNILSLSSPYKFMPQRNFKIYFSQGNIILCGLYQYFFDYHLFDVAQIPFKSFSYLSNQNRSIRFYKLDCPILDTGHVRPFSLDSSKVFWTCLVILPYLSSLL